MCICRRKKIVLSISNCTSPHQNTTFTCMDAHLMTTKPHIPHNGITPPTQLPHAPSTQTCSHTKQNKHAHPQKRTLHTKRTKKKKPFAPHAHMTVAMIFLNFLSINSRVDKLELLFAQLCILLFAIINLVCMVIFHLRHSCNVCMFY